MADKEIRATICFFVRGKEVLLAKKTRKIGVGKRNGYGGKFEHGETPVECSIRECHKESGLLIDPESVEEVAFVDFFTHNEDGSTFLCSCNIHVITNWSGTVVPTEEMADPKWFSIDNLPFAEMMPADQDWVPRALDPHAKFFTAQVYLGPEQKSQIKPTKIECNN